MGNQSYFKNQPKQSILRGYGSTNRETFYENIICQSDVFWKFYSYVYPISTPNDFYQHLIVLNAVKMVCLKYRHIIHTQDFFINFFFAFLLLNSRTITWYLSWRWGKKKSKSNCFYKSRPSHSRKSIKTVIPH